MRESDGPQAVQVITLIKIKRWLVTNDLLQGVCATLKEGASG
jgi:hypothetical protein